MKHILLSIQPQYVEKILNGKKLVEIRKSIPKCDLPCKVHIYCGKAKNKMHTLWKAWDYYYIDDRNHNAFDKVLNSKVVAEFTLNKFDFIEMPANLPQELLSKSCLNGNQIVEYLGGSFYKNFYAWHIDDLVVYDKPKELSGFYISNKKCKNCVTNGCNKNVYSKNGICTIPLKLNKPPQSWCYVEEI